MYLVYLAGKYSVGNRDENIEAASRVAAQLWDMGYAVLCPHMNSARLDDACRVADYEDFLAGGLRMLSGCDILFLMPGWRDSPGSLVERLMARAHDIPIVESVVHLSMVAPVIPEGEG